MRQEQLFELYLNSVVIDHLSFRIFGHAFVYLFLSIVSRSMVAGATLSVAFQLEIKGAMVHRLSAVPAGIFCRSSAETPPEAGVCPIQFGSVVQVFRLLVHAVDAFVSYVLGMQISGILAVDGLAFALEFVTTARLTRRRRYRSVLLCSRLRSLWPFSQSPSFSVSTFSRSARSSASISSCICSPSRMACVFFDFHRLPSK